MMTSNSIATTRRLVLRTCDLVVLVIAFCIAAKLLPTLHAVLVSGGVLRAGWIETFMMPAGGSGNSRLSLVDFVWVFVIMCPTIVICYQLFGAYRPIREQTARSIAFASVLAPLAGVGVLTLVLFAMKRPGYSRLLMFSFALLGGLLLAAGRYAAAMAYRERLRSGYLVKEVALIGTPDTLQRIIATFQSRTPAEYTIIGYFGLSSGQPPPCLSNGTKLTLLGSVHQVGDALIHTPIHDIVIGVPANGAPWLETVLRACDYFRVTTYVVPEVLLRTKLSDLKPVRGLARRMPSRETGSDESRSATGFYETPSGSLLRCRPAAAAFSYVAADRHRHQGDVASITRVLPMEGCRVQG